MVGVPGSAASGDRMMAGLSVGLSTARRDSAVRRSSARSSCSIDSGGMTCVTSREPSHLAGSYRHPQW